MNRDNLDNLLKRKLSDARMEPPGDMWARLQSSLEKMPASEEPSVAERPVEAPAMIIRRPRKLRIGYAAAACVMLACIMIGLRIGFQQVNEEIIAEGTEIIPSDEISDFIDKFTREAVIAQSTETESTNAGESISRKVRDRIFGAESTTRDPLNLVTDVPKEGQGEKPTDIKEIQTEDERSIETSTGTALEQIHEEITSDRSTDGVPVDWARVIAESDRRSRRAAPLNFALYTGDLVRTNSDRGVSSDPMFANESEVPTLANTQGAKEEYKHKLPLSFGLTVNIGLIDRLSIETGVTYTYMYSERVKESEFSNTFKQRLHYIGIPVFVKYDFVDTRFFTFYGSVGGALEKCVSGKTYLSAAAGGIQGNSEVTRLGVKGIQTSVGLNVGFELNFTDRFGLYVEPGIGYYFENSKQPVSYRTANPFNFNLRTGLRLHFK